MTDETCPERIELVQRLGEAINDKKHLETRDSHSTKARMKADKKVNQALDAVRTHKSEGGCQTQDAEEEVNGEKDPAA